MRWAAVDCCWRWWLLTRRGGRSISNPSSADELEKQGVVEVGAPRSQQGSRIQRILKKGMKRMGRFFGAKRRHKGAGASSGGGAEEDEGETSEDYDEEEESSDNEEAVGAAGERAGTDMEQEVKDVPGTGGDNEAGEDRGAAAQPVSPTADFVNAPLNYPTVESVLNHLTTTGAKTVVCAFRRRCAQTAAVSHAMRCAALCCPLRNSFW